MRAAYAGYKGIAKSLIRSLEMIVSFESRSHINGVLELVLRRITELRSKLVAGTPSHVLEIGDVLAQLRMGHETIEIEELPFELLPARERIWHLIDHFGSRDLSRFDSDLPDPLIGSEEEGSNKSMNEPRGKGVRRTPLKSENHPMTRSSAATKIACIYRGIVARRKYKKFALEEYRLLGLLPIAADQAKVEEAKKILLDRACDAKRIRNDWLKEKHEEVRRVKEQIEGELIRRFWPESLIEIWKFKERTKGKLPESMEEALGLVEEAKNYQLKSMGVADLRKRLDKFELNAAIQYVSELEREEMRTTAKKQMMLKLNKELSVIRVREGLKTDPPPIAGDPQMDEQDLIDLIKEGIAKRISIDQEKLIGDIFNSKKSQVPTVAHLKSLVMDEFVIPLCLGCPKESLLLYGPKGCGKSLIFKNIAIQSGSLVFDLSGKLLIRKNIDRILAIAPFVVPFIVLIDNISGKVNQAELGRLIEAVASLDRALLVCTSSSVAITKSLRAMFKVTVLVNVLCVNDRYSLISHLFRSFQLSPDEHIETISVLARITENLPPLSIKRAVSHTFKLCNTNPITARSFVHALSQFQPVSESELTEWKSLTI